MSFSGVGLNAADSTSQMGAVDVEAADQSIAANRTNHTPKDFNKKRKASDLDAAVDPWCERCKVMTGSITGLRSLMSEGGFKHLSLPALKQSATAGCSSCSFILSHLKKIPRKWDDDSVFYLRDSFYTAGRRYEDWKGMEEAKFYSELLFLHPRFGELQVYFEPGTALSDLVAVFFLFADSLPASQFVQLRPMMTDVSSETAFCHARHWVDVCQTQHKKCPGSKLPLLPARVIKVGDNKLGDNFQLHISRTNERGDYAALSYCWGGSQSVTLTTSSIESCLGGQLAASSLPQTIQDAIFTTQRLGFKYLWVDALCIIQDCPNDKAREISRMGGIYKNATVTIAAANAGAASEGFLGPRPLIPSCELPFFRPPSPVLNASKSKRYTSGDVKGPGKVRIAAAITSSDGDDPLYQRAWTMQERLLSPRMLLFGRTELTWQCQQKSTQSIGHTFYRRKTGSKRLPVGIFIYKKQGRREKRLQVQAELWASIVEDYSRRNLSFREDRLPALAGIAEELQTVWNDTYIAGLWKKCLISHMGWKRAGRIKPSSNTSINTREYLAPSWSWVSFNGPVTFDVVKVEDDLGASIEGTAKVVDYRVTPVTSDAPLGRLENGYVTIETMTEMATHPPSQQAADFWEISMDEKAGNLATDSLLYAILGRNKSRKAVGLILVALESTKYKRIGWLKSKNATSGVMSRRQTITI
ncbi:heterokaryon incompatibility protein-domain-containing protein, partial [Cadophora sp. MPI-SDFR-AT-0126]